MNCLIGRVTLAIAVLVLGPACDAGARVQITEVGETACRNLTEDEQKRRGVVSVSVQECPAPAGVSLLVVDNGSQTWPELEWRGKVWSLGPIVMRNRPGDHPTLGSPPSTAGGPQAADRVEWWIGTDDSPEALTFRISGQDTERPGRWRNRLLVVRLSQAGVCLLGTFEGTGANEAARRAASSGRPCSPPLRAIPQHARPN